MSISLRFLKKVRCRILEATTDKPASGVVVTLLAGLGESAKSARLPVGTLCSDGAGYVSFDLDHLLDRGIESVQDLILKSTRIQGGETSLAGLILGRDPQADARRLASLDVIGVGTHVAGSGAYDTAMKDGLCMVFPIRVQPATGAAAEDCGCSAIALPSIQCPDVCDYEASPYSFVSRVSASLGDGCCETMVPVSLPVQEHRFYKVVMRRENPEFNAAMFDSLAVEEIDVNAPLETLPSRIKFGEVLEFKQDWYSLGHSLGEIKYSLALAPGEATQIAIIDWARQDTQQRTDAVTAAEYLDSLQKADRTIQETVDSALHETQGGSSFMVGSTGQATLPLAYVTMTFNHAIGGSVSNSWGNRDLEADSLQNIHNAIRQQSGYSRSLNSTVVVQANQAEQNFLQTRRVANHNHCHALTVQYYEVLRHFRISTEFTGRRKAVLIPFAPFRFDLPTSVRFRTLLENALLDDSLAVGFDSAIRLMLPNAPAEPPQQQPGQQLVPKTLSADLKVKGIEGEGVGSGLTAKPGDGIRITSSGQVMLNRGAFGSGGLGSYTTGPNGETNSADNSFLAPGLRRYSLIFKVGSDGNWQQAGTYASVFAIRTGEVIFGINDTKGDFGDNFGTNADALDVHLEVATMAPPDEPQNPVTTTDDPAAQAEAAREADLLRVSKLIAHLNANQGYYNSVIWVTQSAVERRIRIEAALANYPELMSAIDDLPLAVSGNYVAFPYDGPLPNWTGSRETDPKVPLQDIVTLPTRGVFAEAQLGHCNACEERDPTRMSDWTEMTAETPPEISGINPGPNGQAPTVTPQSLPNNVISIQSAPQFPDPTGLAEALKVLGTPNIFRDMSGLNELSDLLKKLSEESSEANIKALAQRALQKVDDAKAGSSPGSDNGKRTNASESDAGKQIDRLKAIEYAKDKGLIDDQQGSDAAKGVLGGEETTSPGGDTGDTSGGSEDALSVTINLAKYNGPDVRAFLPSVNSKTGQTTLRAVVNGAPAGSTWHWSIASPTAARIVAPNSYITDLVAGDPGLTDVTFEARDPGGTTLGKRTIKICVPQFVAIDEDAAAFNAELVYYHLDDVKPLVLQKAREVAEFLLRRANVRLVWRLAPFGEALPAHLAPGGFAAGKFNQLTIRGTNAASPGRAGETAAGGPAVFNETIDVWPGAFHNNGMDVNLDVTTAVNTIRGLNMTDPAVKMIWIEIMGRLMGENMAHEIVHSLLGTWGGTLPGGHNPTTPYPELMNTGTSRYFSNRTGIDITDLPNFPNTGTYIEGALDAINGLESTNQGSINTVFPVPPALA